MILLPFPGMENLARDIAAPSGSTVLPIALHRFPDGEGVVTLPEGIAGGDLAIVATLRDPDRLALQLRFAAATAREMGAARVGLIAPYLGYMRQDRRFAPGQAVSAPLFARFLGESFNWLVTVDPHLHRIARLGEIFPVPAHRVATASLIAAWIAAEVPDAVHLGPDSESQQWVADVARQAGRPYEVLRKERRGDRTVEITVPTSADLLSCKPVIIDDIASSGRTIAQAVERVVTVGGAAPICILIHAVFAGDAIDVIQAAGAARIVTTNTIPHPSNAISVAGNLAQAIATLPPVSMTSEMTT